MSDALKSRTEQASKAPAYTRGAVGYTFLHGLNFQVSANQPISVQGSSFWNEPWKKIRWKLQSLRTRLSRKRSTM